MANFQPMKDRFLMVLRENVALLGVGGRFLDFGCGRGDVSEVLIREPAMAGGTAYDLAVDAEQQKRSGAREGGKTLKYASRLSEEETGLDLALLFDVIEHVPVPGALLREIERRVRPGGWLVVTVPYNPHEWGVDDDFYGHLRRLSMRGIVSMLEQSGWSVIRVLDPSFPTFWLIRRVYLWTRRFMKLPVPGHDGPTGNDLQRTLASSRQSAWDTGGVMQRVLSYGVMPWRLIRKFDLYFESVYKGFELFVVCQRRRSSPACGVCGHGRFSYHRFFQRYSLQRCSYCRTEQILPETDDASAPPPSPAGPMPGPGGVLLRRWRTRRLEALCRRAPRPASLFVVSRHGAQDVETARLAPAADVRTSTLGEWLARGPEEGRRYGILALFHVFEHVRETAEALEALDRSVEPGGWVMIEYPNSRSWLKRLFRWRWFGYDPPHHRHVIDAQALADQMGLRNYRLLGERHFIPEYSFLVFAQTLVNALMPFQRDALYHWIRGCRIGPAERFWAWVSAPLAALCVPLFLVYQPLASLFRAGCVVRQVFRRTDIVE